MFAQACFQRNYTVVTVYSTLGKEAVAIALAQSEVTTILVNEEDLISEKEKEEPRSLYVFEKCNKITHVIYKPRFPHDPERIKKQLLEPLNAYRRQTGNKELQILSFDEVVALGEQVSASDKNYQVVRKATPTDLAFIMYTSGTTGFFQLFFSFFF